MWGKWTEDEWLTFALFCALAFCLWVALPSLP